MKIVYFGFTLFTLASFSQAPILRASEYQVQQYSQSSNFCSSTIKKISSELETKGVTYAYAIYEKGGAKGHAGNPTQRVDDVHFKLNPYKKGIPTTATAASKNSGKIENVLNSPILMKSWADRIVNNCTNVAAVYFWQDQSDYGKSFAIQSNGKTFQRQCVDWQNPPRWNNMICV
ncbi:MAG: hypothetical protein ACFCU8_15920 [Thermosynechococcaceae cyanobacterium]